MSNWVFVITSSNEEFDRRINQKKWPIYEQTANRKKLRVGDKVIFYKGAKMGKVFSGRAQISSPLTPEDSNYFVELSKIKIWKRHIPIKEVLMDLKFIFHKKNWGVHLQGGAIELPDDDYKTILSKTISE